MIVSFSSVINISELFFQMNKNCFVFGRGLQRFDVNSAPTIADVLKHFYYVKKNISSNDNEARKAVCDALILHWQRTNSRTTSTTLLSKQRIKTKTKLLWAKRMPLQKRKNIIQIVAFRTSCSNKIFNIRKENKCLLTEWLRKHPIIKIH